MDKNRKGWGRRDPATKTRIQGKTDTTSEVIKGEDLFSHGLVKLAQAFTNICAYEATRIPRTIDIELNRIIDQISGALNGAQKYRTTLRKKSTNGNFGTSTGDKKTRV